MRLKVISYNQEQDYHVCYVDGDKSKKMNVDLFVSSCFPEGVSNCSIVGKWVDVEYTFPYISIAHGVSILED